MTDPTDPIQKSFVFIFEVIETRWPNQSFDHVARSLQRWLATINTSANPLDIGRNIVDSVSERFETLIDGRNTTDLVYFRERFSSICRFEGGWSDVF